jgi:CHASE2 domain-containing sensor protein
MTEPEKKPSTLATATGRWRDRLLDAAVITIPTALVTQSVNWLQGRLFAQPWQILWIAVPLAMAAFIAWKLLRHPGARRIDWRFGLFLVLYATFFAVASGSELLVWKRSAIARSTDEGESGRGWLLPATAGDWRYRLLPREELPPGFRVVLLDHGAGNDETKIAKRVLDAQLIDSARRSGASGVFFDVAFEGHTVADPIFCAAVNEAAAAGMPIVTAYALRPFRETGIYAEKPEGSASQTPACLLESAGRPVYRAHAMVLADGDSVVRSVPIAWEPAAGRPPLSVRIAQCVKAKAGSSPPCDSTELAQTAGPLLRIIPAAMEKRMIAGDENVRALFQLEKPFAGQFLFVGEKSPGDLFKTPGDPLTPGVLIHASAVATLVNGDSIQRPPAWFSAFIVIAACVVLALFASQGASPLKMLTAAVVSTLVVFGLAAVAIMQFHVWVDVIYTIAAVWLLLPLLLAYRKFAEPRPGAAAIVEQGVSPS